MYGEVNEVAKESISKYAKSEPLKRLLAPEYGDVDRSFPVGNLRTESRIWTARRDSGAFVLRVVVPAPAEFVPVRCGSGRDGRRRMCE